MQVGHVLAFGSYRHSVSCCHVSKTSFPHHSHLYASTFWYPIAHTSIFSHICNCERLLPPCNSLCSLVFRPAGAQFSCIQDNGKFAVKQVSFHLYRIALSTLFVEATREGNDSVPSLQFPKSGRLCNYFARPGIFVSFIWAIGRFIIAHGS